MAIDNPVNLRGSLDALPQEGSCEWTPERSASSVDRFRAPLSGAVGAQPQRTGVVGGKSACPARGERGLLIYRGGTTGWSGRGGLDCAMGGPLQPGRAGSGGTPAWWSTTDAVRGRGARADSGGVSASAGSQARWDGDLVVEHLATGTAAGTGWPAQGQHVHDLGGATRCRYQLATGPHLVPDPARSFANANVARSKSTTRTPGRKKADRAGLHRRGAHGV